MRMAIPKSLEIQLAIFNETSVPVLQVWRVSTVFAVFMIVMGKDMHGSMLDTGEMAAT